MKTQKSYTVATAQKVLENYCIYQDRCHQEVEKKLASMGMISQACEMIILHLITHNFLNEERFAKSYARGKFNIKKYGKNRIVNALKLRSISDYNIKTALKEIDEEAYLQTFEKLLHQKWENTKELNLYKKKKKVADFMFRKGYESDLIYEGLNRFKN